MSFTNLKPYVPITVRDKRDLPSMTSVLSRAQITKFVAQLEAYDSRKLAPVVTGFPYGEVTLAFHVPCLKAIKGGARQGDPDGTVDVGALWNSFNQEDHKIFRPLRELSYHYAMMAKTLTILKSKLGPQSFDSSIAPVTDFNKSKFEDLIKASERTYTDILAYIESPVEPLSPRQEDLLLITSLASTYTGIGLFKNVLASEFRKQKGTSEFAIKANNLFLPLQFEKSGLVGMATNRILSAASKEYRDGGKFSAVQDMPYAGFAAVKAQRLQVYSHLLLTVSTIYNQFEIALGLRELDHLLMLAQQIAPDKGLWRIVDDARVDLSLSYDHLKSILPNSFIPYFQSQIDNLIKYIGTSSFVLDTTLDTLPSSLKNYLSIARPEDIIPGERVDSLPNFVISDLDKTAGDRILAYSHSKLVTLQQLITTLRVAFDENTYVDVDSNLTIDHPTFSLPGLFTPRYVTIKDIVPIPTGINRRHANKKLIGGETIQGIGSYRKWLRESATMGSPVTTKEFDITYFKQYAALFHLPIPANYLVGEIPDIIVMTSPLMHKWGLKSGIIASHETYPRMIELLMLRSGRFDLGVIAALYASNFIFLSRKEALSRTSGPIEQDGKIKYTHFCDQLLKDSETCIQLNSKSQGQYTPVDLYALTPGLVTSPMIEPPLPVFGIPAHFVIGRNINIYGEMALSQIEERILWSDDTQTTGLLPIIEIPDMTQGQLRYVRLDWKSVALMEYNPSSINGGVKPESFSSIKWIQANYSSHGMILPGFQLSVNSRLNAEEFSKVIYVNGHSIEGYEIDVPTSLIKKDTNVDPTPWAPVSVAPVSISTPSPTAVVNPSSGAIVQDVIKPAPVVNVAQSKVNPETTPAIDTMINPSGITS